MIIKAELTEETAQDFAKFLGDEIDAVAGQYPSYKFRLTGVPAYMKVCNISCASLASQRNSFVVFPHTLTLTPIACFDFFFSCGVH